MSQLNIERLMEVLGDILSEKYCVNVVVTATKKCEEETHE